MDKVLTTVALLAATTIEHDGLTYLIGERLYASEAQATALVQGKAATLVSVELPLVVEAVVEAVATEVVTDAPVADAAPDAAPAAKTKPKK